MVLFRETSREEYWYRRGMLEQYQALSADPKWLDSVAYEIQLEMVLTNAQSQIDDI